MSETNVQNFTAEFKVKVAIEAKSGVKTINELGQAFNVHPTWKKELHYPSRWRVCSQTRPKTY